MLHNQKTQYNKMLMKNETINRIKNLGLNSYETKIWLALLTKNVASAGELSDIANVPRSRAYDVLESLEKKGFVLLRKDFNKT